MDLLVLVIGWILTIFLSFLALIVLWRIATNQIDLKYLISDENGWASLGRFQFLVFTFVIAMSLFYLIVTNKGYPPVPKEILALLGISGGSYVMSKGIQTSHDVGMAEQGYPPSQKKDDDAETPERQDPKTLSPTVTKTPEPNGP